MNKAALAFLLGSGVLLIFSEFLGRGTEVSIPVHVAAALMFLAALILLSTVFTGGGKKEDMEEALELIRDEQKMRIARKEVRAKIPKYSPPRDSQAAFIGSAKIGAARSMATLVRKRRLREKILDICDFADMVLETIRRMPSDTPAAVAFAEGHLDKLNEALERCFETSRRADYRQASTPLDAEEIERFGAFITAFRNQQDNILKE